MNPSRRIFKATETTNFLLDLETLSLGELQAQQQAQPGALHKTRLQRVRRTLQRKALFICLCRWSAKAVGSSAFGTGSGFGASSSNHFPGFSKRNPNNIREAIVPKIPLGILGAFSSSSNWFPHTISRSLLNISNAFNLYENEST